MLCHWTWKAQRPCEWATSVLLRTKVWSQNSLYIKNTVAGDGHTCIHTGVYISTGVRVWVQPYVCMYPSRWNICCMYLVVLQYTILIFFDVETARHFNIKHIFPLGNARVINFTLILWIKVQVKMSIILVNSATNFSKLWCYFDMSCPCYYYRCYCHLFIIIISVYPKYAYLMIIEKKR